MSTIDEKLGGKVKPLIRFLKAWKFFRDVPISSFYLELRVAKFAYTQSTIIYQYDIATCLASLFDQKLARMQDPMDISGYVPACKTDAQYDDAMSKLATAATRAQKALDAAKLENLVDAFDWWRLLFGEGFPTHYY